MQHLVIVGILLSAAGSDPFNPGAYLGVKQEEAAKAQVQSAGGSVGGLTAHSIYRLSGHRFHRLATVAGAVFLPGAGAVPELTEEFAICEQHVRLLGGEVLRVRDGLPIDATLKAAEPQIVAMIGKCKDGLMKSPTLTVVRPDGAVVEIKAKESRDTQRRALETSRDDAFDEKEDAKNPAPAPAPPRPPASR